LGPALGETFKDIDRLIDLSEKIARIEVPIAVFSGLENDLSFPGGCEDK
jgi:hypothetical protein